MESQEIRILWQKNIQEQQVTNMLLQQLLQIFEEEQQADETDEEITRDTENGTIAQQIATDEAKKDAITPKARLKDD